MEEKKGQQQSEEEVTKTRSDKVINEFNPILKEAPAAIIAKYPSQNKYMVYSK